MGIKGLTTYISKNSHKYLEDFELHDTYLVIDGNSLSAQVYKYHCRANDAFGGDYDKFKKSIVDFFNVLKQCKIEPVVILDGGFEWRKLNTLYDRLNNKIHTLHLLNPATQSYYQVFPLMQVDVFKEVLAELNVNFVVCDFEADFEIAVVAKKLNCPVLSYDSDFYIYDVLYIPFPTCNFQPCKRSKDTYYVHCKIYRVDRFLNNFGGLDKSLLPLLATLLGNDYVRKNTFNKFFAQLKLPHTRSKTNDQQRTIAALLEWLRHETVESAERKILGRLKENNRPLVSAIIKKSIESYRCDSTQLLSYLKLDTCETSREQYAIADNTRGSAEPVFVPSWFIENYRKGMYPPAFINILNKQMYLFTPQMEDLSLIHSHDISLPILSVICGLLLPSDEYDHVKYVTRNEYNKVQNYNLIPVHSTRNVVIFPTLNEFSNMTKESCYNLVLDLIQASSKEQEILNTFPSEWKFFIASIIYWIKRASDIQIKSCHIYSLVMCLLNLQVIDNKIGYYRNRSVFDSKYKLKLDLHKNQNVQSDTLDVTGDSPLSVLLNAVTETHALLYADVFIKYFSLDDKLTSNPKQFSVRVVHTFAEFQSVFRHFSYLNSLLQYPLPKNNIADFYNGTFIYNLCLNLIKRNSPNLYVMNLLQPASTVLLVYKKIISDLKILFPEILTEDTS